VALYQAVVGDNDQQGRGLWEIRASRLIFTFLVDSLSLQTVSISAVTTMVLLRSLVSLGVIVLSANAEALKILERAPFEAFGIEKNKDGFGSEPVVDDERFSEWAPPSQLGKKNATMPRLKDRSLELFGRQTCDNGYWYCPSE
jgi:hypothetical protein